MLALLDLGAKQLFFQLYSVHRDLPSFPTRRSSDLQWLTTGIPQSQYATVTTAVIINVVLGGALWASSAITRKNLMNGAIVAGQVSIILIYFCRLPAPVCSKVGNLGAILAAAKPYPPRSRPH